MQKIKASGGGRCNVTNAITDVTELIKKYPRGGHFLRKSLFNFNTSNTIKWFQEREVKLKTEADGRVFPVSDDSQTIIDCIWKEMMLNKVSLFYHKSLIKINKTNTLFELIFNDNTVQYADVVLLTCGGFPKQEQYKWLLDCGHTIQNPVPSLFTFNIPKNTITQLMGVSMPDVTIKIVNTKFAQTGPILITHWGISGPAVLKLSAFAARELNNKNYEFDISINWLNDINETDLKNQILEIRKIDGKSFLYSKNPFGMPKRLWEFILQRACIKEETKWGELPAKEQNRLIISLIQDMYSIKGKTTFKEEFVTAGGINLKEIDANNMQSKLVPGLFFGGEIMDVDGITGGFNFQHAWSSAYIAANGIKEYLQL